MVTGCPSINPHCKLQAAHRTFVPTSTSVLASSPVAPSVHSEDPNGFFTRLVQKMSHSFITRPLKRFPDNDDLQNGVCKSVHTISKNGLLHSSGSYLKNVVLGDLVVFVLAIGPKVHGLKPR
jgi:hypothetical protein